ncbi:MAG TPA: VOC family protein [Actinobacteria bacterium]|nr:VOC family protein [Actinomycetota bacterium]
MLKNKVVAPILPAKDVQRAKDFYHDKLGLEVQSEKETGITLSAGSGTGLFVYQKDDMVNASHTVAGFNVDNIEEEVDELKNQGVDFEEYDMPGIKTVNGIADLGDTKTAWFKDSEGNIISIIQM